MTIPLPIIPNVYRVAFHWTNTNAGLTAVNVMHFKAITPPVTISDVFSTISANITTAMWNTVSNNAKVDSLAILPLDGVSATVLTNTSGSSPWIGGSSDPNTIPQVSALVKIQTGVRGRDNRGRIFLPFTTELSSANGKFGTGIIPPMQTAWTTFLFALEAAPKPLEIGVAAYDRVNRGASAHFTAALSLQVETFTATQRRRQPGRKVSRH